MKSSQKRSSQKERSIRHDPRRIRGFARTRTRREGANRRRDPGRITPREPIVRRSSNNPGSRQKSVKTFTNWWVHLWSGLVRDRTGKHYRSLKSALWLYLYLLVAANWRTGSLFRRITTISAETGLNTRTIQRWLKTLRKAGYIVSRSSGRALQISITKWRPISRRLRGPVIDPPDDT
jgi:hypothetical protein